MYKAIGVILLFDEVMNEYLTNRNQSLHTHIQPINFGAGAIPHLTLAQVIMNETQKKEATSWIQSQKTPQIKIPTNGAQTINSRTGKQYTRLNITVTKPLQSLHENIMNFLITQGLYETTAEPTHFLSPEQVSQGSVNRLQEFSTKHAYENYHPHITVGLGTSVPPRLPNIISPTHLALGRLAPNGTIREILYQRKI